uniref:Uncharacterized protein n=1 Tax=uncultured marine virus TaxID=186617 RepID=A0A0F7L0C8_9VIRU|nr:hypothetical protein [uncultured marine virus]
MLSLPSFQRSSTATRSAGVISPLTLSPFRPLARSALSRWSRIGGWDPMAPSCLTALAYIAAATSGP